MKKVLLLTCLMAATVITYATDVWEGEHAVTWQSTLNIEAAQFADIKTGNKIVVEFKDATGEAMVACCLAHAMNTESMMTKTASRYLPHPQ